MGLFGAPEVAALSYDERNNCVYGVRLKARKRGVYAVSKYASAVHADWQQAANRVLKDLGVNSSVYLLLCFALENSEVFECELPDAAPDVMRGALQFEVPNHIMSVPEDFSLQYVSSPDISDDGAVALRCAVFPEESVHKLCNQLTSVRKKPDAVIDPLLTLPEELPEDEAVQFAEFEEGFCWKSGAWQLAASCPECNQQLDEILKKHCEGKLLEDADFDKYRSALSGALFGIRRLFLRNNILGGVTILPAYMRPARYRAQLRLMALLSIALLGLIIFRYSGNIMEGYNSHRKLANQVKNSKSKVQNLRKKVKSGEKELKDLQRTAELKVGSRECIGVLGYMSERLPDNVQAHYFRWNEGTVDMSMMSNSVDIDLVDFFNRLPGFTVQSATPRNLPNNSGVTASVKLVVFDPEAEQLKAERKAREKAKNKRKSKGK